VFFCAEGAGFHDVKIDLTNASLSGSHRRPAELMQHFNFGHAGQEEDAECRE
jgi:hypothetical protein